jgi:hypothetical protein
VAGGPDREMDGEEEEALTRLSKVRASVCVCVCARARARAKERARATQRRLACTCAGVHVCVLGCVRAAGGRAGVYWERMRAGSVADGGEKGFKDSPLRTLFKGV